MRILDLNQKTNLKQIILKRKRKSWIIEHKTTGN